MTKANKEGISRSLKARTILRRHEAGEALDALAAEYSITVTTARGYLGIARRERGDS